MNRPTQQISSAWTEIFRMALEICKNLEEQPVRLNEGIETDRAAEKIGDRPVSLRD